jgi:hypothetical protein
MLLSITLLLVFCSLMLLPPWQHFFSPLGPPIHYLCHCPSLTYILHAPISLQTHLRIYCHLLSSVSSPSVLLLHLIHITKKSQPSLNYTLCWFLECVITDKYVWRKIPSLPTGYIWALSILCQFIVSFYERHVIFVLTFHISLLPPFCHA